MGFDLTDYVIFNHYFAPPGGGPAPFFS